MVDGSQYYNTHELQPQYLRKTNQSEAHPPVAALSTSPFQTRLFIFCTDESIQQGFIPIQAVSPVTLSTGKK